MATICTFKCNVCGNWCASFTTKNNKPYLYCGECGYGHMILSKQGIEHFYEACQEVNETELIPKTLAWYKKKTGGEVSGTNEASEKTPKIEPGEEQVPRSDPGESES